MLTIGEKQYRNLQEQVLQNQTDIQYLLNEGGVLNEFGIRVVGQVNQFEQLPNPATYEGEFGDAFAVGTETPYELYIWTRAFSGQTGSFWFNIGLFPAPSTVPGPIGPQGIQGQQGIRGSLWYSQSGVPTIIEGVNNNDQAVDGITGDIYQFVNGTWELTGNIRGPQGIQGVVGPIGPIGPEGPQGIQGPKGDQGQFIEILGTLDNINQLPMPDDVPRYAAYLIPIDGANHIYLLVGEGTTANPIQWVDAGAFGGGSQVKIDGVNQNEVELGYVPKISVNYEIGEDTTVTTNGSEVTFTNLQTVGYNVNNEQIEGMGTIELPLASSGEVEFSAKNNTIEANLASETWTEIENIVEEAKPQEVQINAPTTATNGQLDETQMETLQNNKGAYLMFNNEIYRLQDTQHISGYLVYSHLGFENTTQTYVIKCITITINTRGWVLTTKVVGDVEGLLPDNSADGTWNLIGPAVNSLSYPTYSINSWGNNAQPEQWIVLYPGQRKSFKISVINVAGEEYNGIYAQVFQDDLNANGNYVLFRSDAFATVANNEFTYWNSSRFGWTVSKALAYAGATKAIIEINIELNTNKNLIYTVKVTDNDANVGTILGDYRFNSLYQYNKAVVALFSDGCTPSTQTQTNTNQFNFNATFKEPLEGVPTQYERVQNNGNTYTFPAKSGTLATLDDIQDAIGGAPGGTLRGTIELRKANYNWYYNASSSTSNQQNYAWNIFNVTRSATAENVSSKLAVPNGGGSINIYGGSNSSASTRELSDNLNLIGYGLSSSGGYCGACDISNAASRSIKRWSNLSLGSSFSFNLQGSGKLRITTGLMLTNQPYYRTSETAVIAGSSTDNQLYFDITITNGVVTNITTNAIGDSNTTNTNTSQALYTDSFTITLL